MLLRVQGGAAAATQPGVKSVMVCGDDGAPLAVFLDAKGKVIAKSADEPGFAAFLEQLGFPVKVSVVSEL